MLLKDSQLHLLVILMLSLSLGAGVATLSGTGSIIAPVTILAYSTLSGTSLVETAGRGYSIIAGTGIVQPQYVLQAVE